MSDAAEQRRLDELLAAIPYIGFLGMSAELVDGGMIARLPFRDALVGNTQLPALHGGVLGAFMEMTALMWLAHSQPSTRQPRTIDITLEYLRPGRARTTFARADIRKIGRRIANVQVEAWQEARQIPVAALRGHFRLGDGGG